MLVKKKRIQIIDVVNQFQREQRLLPFEEYYLHNKNELAQWAYWILVAENWW